MFKTHKITKLILVNKTQLAEMRSKIGGKKYSNVNFPCLLCMNL